MMLIASWILTAACAALHLRSHQRFVLVARAGHEVRGALFAAQLGLGALVADAGRVAAIELELQRAGRALEDLAAAPSGSRGRTEVELVDLAALIEAYAPAWASLAAAHGAELRVEAPDGGAEVMADPLRIAQACANL